MDLGLIIRSATRSFDAKRDQTLQTRCARNRVSVLMERMKKCIHPRCGFVSAQEVIGQPVLLFGLTGATHLNDQVTTSYHVDTCIHTDIPDRSLLRYAIDQRNISAVSMYYTNAIRPGPHESPVTIAGGTL